MHSGAWRRATTRIWAGAYAVAMHLLAPYALARWWWRGRTEPLYRQALGERFGRYRQPPMPADVWLHAVSLGETNAAAVLIEALRFARPGLVLVLTHGTATGRAAGLRLLQPGDRSAWLPWDTPGATRRFFAQHCPAVGVLMETEVWPGLLRSAGDAGVPVVLANARLSARSLGRGARLAPLLQPAMHSLAQVLAQTDADAERLRAAGARTVQVAGNLKYDVAPDAALLARGRAWRAAVGRPVLLAASTRDGEEALLLAAWATSQAAARPLLLIVPRHPQRFDAVAALVAAQGWTLARRSSWTGAAETASAAAGAPGAAVASVSSPPGAAADADVWLGDSVGEMPLYYGLATAALLGGSFLPFGGQNLIEAAACGCPVVLGPSTHNFAQAAELAIAAGAAVRCNTVEAAVTIACGWLTGGASADGERAVRAHRAQCFAATHGGAAARMARVIAALLQPTDENVAPSPLRRGQ